MGCYNITGFYSHLPIKNGDRVGAILCAKQDRREDLAMETVSAGIYPVMAPIYGEYNDYGGADMEASPSAHAFEQLTSISAIEFAELIHDFPGINAKSKRSETTEYVGILKRLKPVYHGIQYEQSDKRYLADAIAKNDQYMINMLTGSIRYHKKEKANLSNATFFFIFEHESILKQLHDIGYTYLNGPKWGGANFNASDAYDRLVEYVAPVKCSIFQKNKADSKYFEANKKALKKLKKSVEKYKQTKNDKDILSVIDRYELDAAALKAEKELLADFILYSDYFGCVYKNLPNLDYTDKGIKNDILDMLYIDRGLYWLGGMYELSTYAHQEIHSDELIAMKNTFNAIIDKIIEEEKQ